MSNDIKELEISEMADEFIAVGNKLVRESKQDVGRVSAAFRYAAARFNAHDAFSKSKDLANDKDNAINWYTEQYRKMLTENIDQLIKMAAHIPKDN